MGKHVEFMRTILETHGVCIMYNMPEDPECDGSVLDQFCKDYLGGLQKHPLRETAHWRISTEESKLDESTTFNNNNDRVELLQHGPAALQSHRPVLVRNARGSVDVPLRVRSREQLGDGRLCSCGQDAPGVPRVLRPALQVRDERRAGAPVLQGRGYHVHDMRPRL